MQSGIFLSYRRADVRHVAGRLARELEEAFGKGRVFRDVEDISPGLDFTEVLKEALDSCAVMLVLIGPKWLDLTDADGKRRLDNPDDWARVEIATGLERNVRVVPVLVEGTQLPQQSELPDNLKVLSRRQAIPLSDDRWRGDVERLIKALKKIPELQNADDAPLSSELPPPDIAPELAPGASGSSRQAAKMPLARILLAAAGVLFLGGLLTLFALRGGGVKVPDLEGMTQSQASQILRDANLEIGEITKEGSNKTPGIVVGQSPEPETKAKRSAKVNFMVATDEVKVPNLGGMTQNQASQILRDANLEVGKITRKEESNKTPGIVVSQSPEPDKKAKRGDKVDVAVAIVKGAADAVKTIESISERYHWYFKPTNFKSAKLVVNGYNGNRTLEGTSDDEYFYFLLTGVRGQTPRWYVDQVDHVKSVLTRLRDGRTVSSYEYESAKTVLDAIVERYRWYRAPHNFTYAELTVYEYTGDGSARNLSARNSNEYFFFLLMGHRYKEPSLYVKQVEDAAATLRALWQERSTR